MQWQNEMAQHLLMRQTEGYLEALEGDVSDYCGAITRIKEALVKYDTSMKSAKKDRKKMHPVPAKEHERRLARNLLIEVRRLSELDDS